MAVKSSLLSSLSTSFSSFQILGLLRPINGHTAKHNPSIIFEVFQNFFLILADILKPFSESCQYVPSSFFCAVLKFPLFVEFADLSRFLQFFHGIERKHPTVHLMKHISAGISLLSSAPFIVHDLLPKDNGLASVLHIHIGCSISLIIKSIHFFHYHIVTI